METVEVGAGTVKSLADRGWIELREVEVMRDPYAGRAFTRTSPSLTEEQSSVFAEIRDAVAEERMRYFCCMGLRAAVKQKCIYNRFSSAWIWIKKRLYSFPKFR